MILDAFLEFAFMRRAALGCIAISLGAAPMGCFLLLRRMSLTGDAMAHAILPGAAVGFLVSGLSLGAMTVGGIVAGLTVALLSGVVTRVTALKEDASLAAFYLISLAAGVLIVSTHGSNVDLLHVLFGTVLALDDAALRLLCGVTAGTWLVLALIYRPLVLECVDPQFLRSVSRLSAPVHLAFLGLVVVNLVAGFQALGTLMAVGLMILPASAARFWTESLGAMIALAIAIGVMASLAGLSFSYALGWPSGPAIVLMAGAAHVLSLILGRQGGLLARAWPARSSARNGDPR